MLKRTLSFRVVGPTVFVSLLLLGSCTGVAVYLHRQQRGSAERYGENVGSRRVAHELEVALNEMLLSELRAVLHPATDRSQTNAERISELYERIDGLLGEAQDLADKPTERELVAKLVESFRGYTEARQAALAAPAVASQERRLGAIETLDSDTLPICRDLRRFNSQATEESQAAHALTVRWMAWGLAAVGVIGSLAGSFLGYGVARGLRRSIYQLSVRVRDAADKLGQERPALTITEDGDLHHVHQQMHGIIGEVEQVVERLQQREREVLRNEQMAAVGQIAAGVAHELRNPLTSIKMLVQTKRRQPGAAGPSATDLQVIEQEIRRMERCLQTFLDFARPPRLVREPIDLAGVVDRTFTLIAGRASKQQVSLDFTAPDGPVGVSADREQLQQLLVNLTLNALDAMPRGGTLTVQIVSADGRAELRVLDTGPGISDQILPRLFEPFVSGKETGIGLGLVVSRRIAEDHGGGLDAHNRSEGGACFVFQLPMLTEALTRAV